jgi:putative hemolysin
MKLKNTLLGAVLLSALSTAAAAQTDFGSALGAGAGAGAAIAPLGVPRAAQAGMAAARAAFLAAAGGGDVAVSNPAGGTVMVPSATAVLIADVLAGGPSSPGASSLAQVLGGGAASPQSTALVTALGNMGTNPTAATVRAAISAFNALVSAGGGAEPSAGALGVRAAIVQAIPRSQR